MNPIEQEPLFSSFDALAATPTGPDHTLTIVNHGSVLDATLSVDGRSAAVLVSEDVLSVWRLLLPHLFEGAAIVLAVALLVLVWRGWRQRPARADADKADTNIYLPARRTRRAIKLALTLVLATAAGGLASSTPPPGWGKWFDWYSSTAFDWLGRRGHYSGLDQTPVWSRQTRLWLVDLDTGRRVLRFALPDKFGGYERAIAQLGFSPDGSRLVVVDAYQNQLTALDTATGRAVSHWPGLGYPNDVRFDSSAGVVDVVNRRVSPITLTRLSMNGLAVNWRVTVPDPPPDAGIAPALKVFNTWSGAFATHGDMNGRLLRVLHPQPEADRARWLVTDLRPADWRVAAQRPLTVPRFSLIFGVLSPDGRHGCIHVGDPEPAPNDRIIIGRELITPIQVWDVDQPRKLLHLTQSGAGQWLTDLLDEHLFVATYASGPIGGGYSQISQSHLWRMSLADGQWRGPRTVPRTWPQQWSDLVGRWPPPDQAFVRHTADGRRSVTFSGNQAYVIDW